MDTLHPWPNLREADRWLIDLMEERFTKTRKTAQQLRARAQELRAEAAQTDMHGYRDAALALADPYEQAAAARPLTHSLSSASLRKSSAI